MNCLAACVVAFVVAAVPAHAQHHVRLGSELDDYLRYLELAGQLRNAPLLFRSPSVLARTTADGPDSVHFWSRHHALNAPGPTRGLRTAPLDPEGHTVFNSRYPRHRNEGTLWGGRGLSAALTTGVQLSWGPLTATFDPTVAYAQNRDFDLAPDTGRGIDRRDLSPFAYAWQNGNIDWPERLGDKPFALFDWGQSRLGLEWRGLAAGVSTENMWWGPATQNPILMSNSAAGFPHLDLGTARPISVSLGHVELHVVWGRLAESAYFDTLPWNDTRLLAGLTAAFRPRWIPGLTLGAARVFHQIWDSLSTSDFLAIFQTPFKGGIADSANPSGDDVRDQMLALSARWTLPDTGFEAYVEWARNDHNWDIRNFLLEPDHSRAYTIGFQQLLPGTRGRVRLRGESTTLGRPAPVLVRPTPVYYTHHIARQGYTHRGQLLGASMGPGSQSQYLGLDRFDAHGRLGLFLQRIRFDDDAYFTSFRTATESYQRHQTELTLGVSAARFLGPLDVSAGVALSRELNRHYVPERDVTNLAVDLRVRIRTP
jgi:hypothetical protein